MFWNFVNIGSVNMALLDCSKPLTKTVSTCHQRGPIELTSWQFYKNCLHNKSQICAYKLHVGGYNSPPRSKHVKRPLHTVDIPVKSRYATCWNVVHIYIHLMVPSSIPRHMIAQQIRLTMTHASRLHEFHWRMMRPLKCRRPLTKEKTHLSTMPEIVITCSDWLVSCHGNRWYALL